MLTEFALELFRALLFSGMSETNRESIEIKEAKPEAFRLLLQYIYTGKLQLRNEQVSAGATHSASKGGFRSRYLY